MTDVVAVLLDMRNGDVAADVNRKFNEMLTAVMETGQKGKLTLSLTVSPSKLSMERGVIEVETSHEVTIKKPELAIGKSLFFVAKDGNLTRNNPSQEEMFGSQEVTNG